MSVRVSSPDSRTPLTSRPAQPKQVLVASVGTQPLVAAARPSDGPRRTLDSRPVLSSRYVR
jgi:hypothetical protein